MATASRQTAEVKQLLRELSATDESQIARLFAEHDCRHVYLDVGSNVGVQLRKLFEPDKYPKAKGTHDFYAAFFGAAEAPARCGVCAVGVEPNPHHRERLVELARRYSAAGVGVIILHAAASDADGIAHLALVNAAKKDRWNDLGASASEAWAGFAPAGNKKNLAMAVRAIELGRIVHTVHRHMVAAEVRRAGGAPRPPGSARTGQLVMKLDIEGTEFAVLPSLVRSQAFCLIDAIRIEFHVRFWKARVGVAAAAARNLTHPREIGAATLQNLQESLRDKFRTGLVPSSDCRAKLLEVEDESYMHDRKPWPDAPLCKR